MELMSEPFAETRGRGGALQPALPELVGALGICVLHVMFGVSVLIMRMQCW